MNRQVAKFNQINGIKLNRNNQSWLDLLTNNQEDAETFKMKFEKKGDMFDVMTYRGYLLNVKGRGQDLTVKDLNEINERNSRVELINVLEEMFLEPIGDGGEFDYYLKCKITNQNLLRLHNEHRELRFASLITAWKILLEQSNRKVVA